ncbi:hypothetical protein EV644_118129 [Kribbella orskensis]|uniref:Uncharacterized protein n=1 Tax=Kribbella orskensis TaxID=2512216 RepID=A0ABY2BC80_9ACTN|nr:MULTISPECIES: hypothetical protein [Kribbella]TCN34879.1 hypothetical protein EV642_119128 [Kribbella sp. VKM Ac-2500]TCO15585.1 hypothetical protein EV644_118129 [Kribbella orskensis]
MTEPTNPRELLDQKLAPYLPYIGSIAVEAARIEWGLWQLAAMLTKQPMKTILRWKSEKHVAEIKKALQAANVKGTDREPSADAITTWATTAQELLKRRGDLMHSWWILGDTPTPDDLVRTGQLTEEQAQKADPTDYVNVYSYRLRSHGDDPVSQHRQTIKRTATDMADFARSLRDHVDNHQRTWIAAGVVLGLWPAPDK